MGNAFLGDPDSDEKCRNSIRQLGNSFALCEDMIRIRVLKFDNDI